MVRGTFPASWRSCRADTAVTTPHLVGSGTARDRGEGHADFSGSASHLAVFPLAVPSLASPGAMLAVVMLTDNHRYSVTEQIFTAAAMLSVLAITLGLFLLAGPIQRIIGDSGASIVSRVMGLVLASVAVDNILHALTAYFNLG